MERSACWRANKELKEEETLSSMKVQQVNAVFVATTRNGNVASVYYKFKNPVCRSTMDKIIGDEWLIIPVDWWAIRRWMVIATEERHLLLGKELLLLEENNRIQCTPSTTRGDMFKKKSRFRACKRLRRIMEST